MIPGLLNQSALRSGSGVAGPTDPHFANVVLLMGFQGANGSTGSPGMDDESSAAHGTATVHGSAAISSTQALVGSTSIRFNGSGTQDLIHFPDSADWDIGAGLVTIECFINPVSLPAGFHNLISQWGNAPRGWALWNSSDQLAWLTSTTGSNVNFDMTSASGLITTGSWIHTGMDYDGSKYRAYIGGSTVATFATPRTIFNSTSDLSIGGDFEQLLDFYNGYMAEVRITKGVARYANDTSYTIPTVPFPRS